MDSLQGDMQRVRWRLDALPKILHHIADVTGSVDEVPKIGAFDSSYHDPEVWCAHNADQVALEVISVTCSVDELRLAATLYSPLVLPLFHSSGNIDGFLLIGGWTKGRARVVLPTFEVEEWRLEKVLLVHSPSSTAMARARLESELSLLERALPKERANEIAEEALMEGLESGPVWVFRPRPNASLSAVFARERFLIDAIMTLFLQVLGLGLAAFTWVLAAKLTFSGEGTHGWFLALLLTSIGSAFAMLGSFFAIQRLTVRGGLFFKRLMLLGAFCVADEKVREEGTGKSLTRALEGDELASTIFAVIFQIFSAVALCVVVGFVIPFSPWAMPLGLLYIVTLVTIFVWSRRIWKLASKRVDGRLQQTHYLIEYMTGFRTMIAQGVPWSEGEVDRGLANYATSISRENQASAAFFSLPAYLWLIASATLVALITTDGGSLTEVVAGAALAVGGYRGFFDLTQTLGRSLPTLAASQRVVEMVSAAREPWDPGSLLVPKKGGDEDNESAPILSLRGVGFSYPNRQRPVLSDINWDICKGDRILLRGPSGSGKSTAVSILAGTKEPTKGLVFAHGFDTKSVGTASLRRVTALAPQFHENAIIPHNVLLNMSLGHRWPPSDADIQLVTEICEELGLGDLLRRMPSGLDQLVGEGGWHLSHGEQSRVFLARTLLQDCPVVILDESFAALDPETLELCVASVLKRAEVLIVIEHIQ